MAENSKGKKSLIQLIKFALVGVLNTLVDLGVYRLLLLINFGSWWVYGANVISYACGVLCSYFCNRSWTFERKDKKSLREFSLFVIVNLVSLGVSLGLIWLFKRVLPFTGEELAAFLPSVLAGVLTRDFICKLLATPFVILVNFIGSKLLVFRNKGKV
jgi:putative flippase GtrA